MIIMTHGSDDMSELENELQRYKKSYKKRTAQLRKVMNVLIGIVEDEPSKSVIIGQLERLCKEYSE